MFCFFIVGLSLMPLSGVNANITNCPATLPSGQVGYSYSYDFKGSQECIFFPPWSVTSGTLPPGLSLDSSSGIISGTPTQAGTYNFTIRHTEGVLLCNKSSSCNCTLIIGTPGCAFVGGSNGAINFTIDPSTSPGPIYGNVTAQINFICESGKPFNVTASPAGGWTLTGPGTMNYTPGFISGGTGQGTMAISLLTTGSSILQTHYQDAPYGVYNNGSQAVTFTIHCPTCSAPNVISATLPATTGVTANVTDMCIATAAGSIAFNIDPSGSGTLNVSTTNNGTDPTAKCTKGRTYSVSCTSLHGNVLTIGNDGVTDPLAYNISTCGSSNSLTGKGFSTPASIPVGISISQAAYQNARVGDHQDTITVTVTY